MLINNWDISLAHARQWNVRRGYSAITNQSEWTAGSNTPAVFSSKIGFKTLQVTLVVKAIDKEEVQLGISKILSALRDPAEIVLDGYDRKFFGVLISYEQEEVTQRRNQPFHRLTLNLEGYEYSAEITKTGTSSLTVYNPGTAPTPVILTIDSRYAGTITITGLGKQISLQGVTGREYVINGETGLMTADGSLANVNIWSLPYLEPGNNTITVSTANAPITIQFKPRYM